MAKKTELDEVRSSYIYWGKVVHVIYDLNDISIVVSDHPTKKHKVWYSIFINGKSAGRAADTLEYALVDAVAFKHEGANSRATDYFFRMIGAVEDNPS